MGVVLGRQIATRGLHEPASPLGFKAIALYTARGYRPIPYYGRYDQALAFGLDLA